LQQSLAQLTQNALAQLAHLTQSLYSSVFPRR
jgi:hypothetical protein